MATSPRRVRGPRWIVLGLSLLIIGAADVPWGDFQAHAHWSNVRVLFSAARPSDVVVNVFLFLPFGLALRSELGASTAAVAGIAFTVATLAEGSQVFSHSRIPAVLDVLCNVTGALMG